MHARNPFGSKTGHEYFEKAIPLWRDKIVKLLNNHSVKVLGHPGFWLIHMHELSDNEVHYYEFMPVEFPLSFKKLTWQLPNPAFDPGPHSCSFPPNLPFNSNDLPPTVLRLLWVRSTSGVRHHRHRANSWPGRPKSASSGFESWPSGCAVGAAHEARPVMPATITLGSVPLLPVTSASTHRDGLSQYSLAPRTRPGHRCRSTSSRVPSHASP